MSFFSSAGVLRIGRRRLVAWCCGWALLISPQARSQPPPVETGLEWQAGLTKAPGAFPPLRPMHAHYKFGWTALNAAEAEIDITRQKGGLTRMAVVAKSLGLVRTTWKMNAEHVSIIHTATLRPVSMLQTEVYRKESEKTKVDFNAEGLERRHEVTPAEGKVKTKRFKFADVYDLHAALQFMRSQALKPGDIYKLVCYPGNAPYLVEVDVGQPARLKVGGKQYPALPLELKLWKIEDKTMQLRAHDDFTRGTVWISDDADRLPLRLEAEIMVGSVWGELDKVEIR